MVLSPPLRLPVPSAGLLCFLRHQTASLFAAEGRIVGRIEGTAAVRTARHARCDEQGIAPVHRRRPAMQRTVRRLVGGGAEPATLQAGVVGLDGLVLRSVRPKQQAHSPAQPAFFSTSPPGQSRWPSLERHRQKQIDHLEKKLQALQQQQQLQQQIQQLQGGKSAPSGPSSSNSAAASASAAAAAATSSSSSASSSWRSRFARWKWPDLRSKRSSLQPGDLPDLGSTAEFASVMFNARRLMTAKAALEPRLRCTEVDENGEVILVDGEFKKTELIAKYGLLPRDLRKIDSSNLPHILVRPAAILLNLLHLKVLIKSDRVLLFDVYGSKTSYPQSAFLYDLQARLHGLSGIGASSASGSGSASETTSSVSSSNNGQLPYEFRALEAVLLSVTSELEAEYDTVREPVLRILHELEADITRDKLRILLVLSKKVSQFEQKAKLVRDAIEELLEADDDLAAMYLTEKQHGLVRGEDDHTEVEMLLESYHKICDEVVQEASSLVSSIRNTEDIIRAILDANRNALMLLDIKFSIGTLGLAMGTFMAGLYGMNLENFIEHTEWGFGAVSTASFAFSLLVCWYALVKLRKVQRVKMHGSSVGGPRRGDFGGIGGGGGGAGGGGVGGGGAGFGGSAVSIGGGSSDMMLPGTAGALNGLAGTGVAAAALNPAVGSASSVVAGTAAASNALVSSGKTLAGGTAIHPLDARSQARLRRLGMMQAALSQKKYY